MKTLAIVVNYKSAPLTLKAVESVLSAASLGPIEVAVVDNSEDEPEALRLRQGLPPTVRLWISPENIGFARACNRALDGFQGEAILLINPDARLLSGCLKQLQKTLFSDKKRAAVSPQIFWDDGLTFYLPPSCPPALFEFQSLLNAWGPGTNVRRLLSCLWRRHAIKVWRSERPIHVRNLTGGLVLLKMEAVQRAGGLFDPRFFLYFEDTDLFIRLRKTGYDLAFEPRAMAIHHYDQCGAEDLKGKRASMAVSLPIFLEKHGGRWACYLRKVLRYLPPSGERQAEGSVRTHEFTTPFTIEIPHFLHGAWLFEWSPNPDFIPSAGMFGKGPHMEFHKKYWELLAPGRYFGRLGRPSRCETGFLEFSWRLSGTEGAEGRREVQWGSGQQGTWN